MSTLVGTFPVDLGNAMEQTVAVTVGRHEERLNTLTESVKRLEEKADKMTYWLMAVLASALTSIVIQLLVKK